MTAHLLARLTLVAAILAGTTSRAADPAPRAPSPVAVRVMSFNIRYDNPKDGEDRWEKRRDFLVDTVRAYRPDLLGMQEVLATQGDFIQEKLTDYGFVGAGRDDGKRKGEF